jgi:hypothetical protein
MTYLTEAEEDLVLGIAARIVAARAERQAMRPDRAASIADDRWISEAEAAEVAGISADALRKHRERGTGPEFRTHRGRYRYQRQAVIDWARRKLVRSTGHGSGDGEGEAA